MRIKTYTKEQLSKFFGVSIASIDRWINENRFSELYTSDKQVEVPETALWLSSSDVRIPMKEVVEVWEKQYSKSMQLTVQEEKNLIANEIKSFEHKYGGTLEETLMFKKKKTDEELHDQQDWEYFIKRLKNI